MHSFNIPDEIESVIGLQDYTADHIGMSDSEVRIYRNHVLKIQPHSDETDNEYAISKWLNGRICIPEIQAYCVKDNTAYTLMSRAEGRMLCDKEYLNNPALAISIAAQGIKQLWQISVEQCPCQASRLENRLKKAEYNVKNNLVDMSSTEPETFSPGGFRNCEELLEWLYANRPEEDIVLTHGDYCLPNIFAKDNSLSGFIDIGKMGPADRWQDIAIAIRSLDHNFAGRYSDGKRIFDFKPQMLTDALGLEFDEEKYRYYILLDELF